VQEVDSSNDENLYQMLAHDYSFLLVLVSLYLNLNWVVVSLYQLMGSHQGSDTIPVLPQNFFVDELYVYILSV
jgi:hypothetical protein